MLVLRKLIESIKSACAILFPLPIFPQPRQVGIVWNFQNVLPAGVIDNDYHICFVHKRNALTINKNIIIHNSIIICASSVLSIV